MAEGDAKFLFDHPEIKELFHDLFSTLVVESDRGAVLIGAAHVDEYLKSLFQAMAPSRLWKKRGRSLLKYGVLSSFGARVEVAYATRLIGSTLYDSFQELRRIRNEVAHHPKSFSLRGQAERVRRMYELGPGMPVGINRVAIEVMMHLKVGDALDSVKALGEDRPYFNTPREVMEFILDKPQIIERLEEQLPRYELAIAIAAMCAVLVWRREAILGAVGEEGLVGQAVENNG